MAIRKTPPPQPAYHLETEAFQVDDLMRKVTDGAVRIPPLQHELKWEDEDRIAFFDSLYRGYPVGTLLFWRRMAPAARASLGGLTLDVPAHEAALWVVDGQQRLTTLAEAWLGRPTASERSLYFDLVNGVFQCEKAQPPGRNDPSRLPLSVALAPQTLIEWLSSRPRMSESQMALALSVGDRIRERQIPSCVVATSDEQILRTIFHRMNRSERRLEEADVFDALRRSQSPELPSDLRQLAQSFAEWGFGSLSEGDVLNTLLAVQGSPLDGDPTDALAPEEATAALPKTEAALLETIVFLRRDADIPHLDLLPCALPIVVLSRFFHLFPALRARSRSRLRRWLWRSALGGHLPGSTHEVQQQIACIQEGDDEGSVTRLLALAGDPPAENALNIDVFDFARPRSKLQCCALAALRPRNLSSGEPIDVSALLSATHKDDGTERIPLISPSQGANQALAHGLSNRILHPSLPTREIIDAIVAVEDRATLASHAIPLDAQKALRGGDVDRFLEIRKTALQTMIDRFFMRQAEWGADDSPSIESMTVD